LTVTEERESMFLEGHDGIEGKGYGFGNS